MAKLEALMLGTVLGRVFEFEHKTKNGKVQKLSTYIRPLTPTEMDMAQINAETYVRSIDREGNLPQSKREEMVYGAEQIETLAYAMRDPDDVDSVWAGSATIREKFSTAEIGTLLRAYHDTVDDIGPSMNTLTAARYEGLVEACAKDASDRPLFFCDSLTRRDFVVSMASELWMSRMDKSSPTLESNVPSIESQTSTEASAPSLPGEPQNSPG